MWNEIFAVVYFYGLGIFSVSRYFLRLGVMKQECSVIVRWRAKLCDYVNSLPRLSDFTECGVKHSKYSIKLTT